MKNRIMVIYDSDLAYARKLMGFLNQKENFPFEVQMVTSEENLEQVLHERKLEVLLLGEESDSKREYGTAEVLFLSELESEDSHHIYKYQSMESMMNKIRTGTASKEDKKEDLDSGGFFMTGIFSPFGGCGKTTISQKLAGKYGEKGRTLYLNFDLIGNTYLEEPEIVSNNVQELFYRIHEKVLEEEKGMASFLCKTSEVYYLGASPYRRELWNLSKEDMNYWLGGIRKTEEFQYVVLDIGFFNESMLEAMKQCDRVILLNGKYEFQKEKTSQFYNILDFCGEKELIQNIREIEAPDYGEHMELVGKLVK